VVVRSLAFFRVVKPTGKGGATLTTECMGRLDVVIEFTPGNPGVNTCESQQGIGTQVNLVVGVTSVVIK
jgi:hypothetical protein